MCSVNSPSASCRPWSALFLVDLRFKFSSRGKSFWEHDERYGTTQPRFVRKAMEKRICAYMA